MSEQSDAPRHASVLVVDDERSIRVTLAAFLQEDGYTVSTAADAAEAEALLGAQSFELVVTDIVMPRLSGVQLLRRIRDRNPEALVLIMTGEPTVETAVEAVRAGAYDYLTKPVSKQAILHHVGRAMGVSQLRHEKRRLEAANRDYQENLERMVQERTQDLRESEARLLLALTAARAVAWQLELAGDGLIEVGPVDVVFGLPPGTHHTSQQAFFNSVHPDDREQVRQLIRAAAEPGALFTAAFRVLTADGSIRWIDAQGRVGVDTAGRPAWLQGIGRDVTEQRQLQASLAQSDRLASMGMLAAGVAHEINNPLSYLLFHLESLTEDLPSLVGAAPAPSPAAESDPPLDVLERVSEALQGANRIREISRALGAFSRVEETDPVPVELQVAIEHACRMAQNEVKYRAQLVTEFAARLPQVLATEGKLAQVFLNLLVNAAHAMDESHADTNQIVVRTWCNGARVGAQVRDTGKGIRPDHLPHIFEPFFTTKPVGVGSGLGLPICRSLIAGFGGEITVASELGVGTVFDLWLPALPSDWAAAEGSPAAAVRERPTAGRVLVIDDDDAVRGVLRRVLQGEHSVVEAASGAEAQQLLAGGAVFEAIVCDVMMPQMSGIELHRWLADHRPELASQVIFVTGGAFTPAASDYLGTVANPSLTKPFQPATVREVVNQMVRACGPGESRRAG